MIQPVAPGPVKKLAPIKPTGCKSQLCSSTKKTDRGLTDASLGADGQTNEIYHVRCDVALAQGVVSEVQSMLQMEGLT